MKLELLFVLTSVAIVACQNCGPRADNAKCADENYPCCSQYGWCGSTKDHCETSCQDEFSLKCNFRIISCSPVTVTKTVTVQPTETPVISFNLTTVTECTKPNSVALTFDDGPFRFTDRLLDILKVNNVKATFFVNGNNRWNMNSNPEAVRLIKRAFGEGHQIASHTWSHPDMTTLSEEQITQEMKLLSDGLFDIIGKRPRHMRPPFGSTNILVENTMKKLGYRIIMWSADSNDWRTPDISPELSTAFPDDSPNKKIVLQHDTLQYSVEPFTQTVIDYIKRKGLTAMTVSNCLDDTAYF
jgi:peptidoglycan/xylan/chitin deacetylase (PgdA/CDA1 family)